MAQRILKVCIGEAGFEVGTLWFESAGGREHSSFQYSDKWLSQPRRFAIAPMLPLDADRRFFKARGEKGSPLPAPVAGTTPDSWGRGVVRKDARLGKTRTGPLTEIDFLTAVDDFSRVGALRFRDAEAGSPFLETAEGGRHQIPPLLHLDQLGKAIASAESDEPDVVALRRLRQVATSLGGARPKCSVIDSDGSLAIAKFTSRLDSLAVERAEVLTLRLARLCGIDAPDARIELSDGLPVAIIKRFDRSGHGRIPFISAQTMLDAPVATGATYTELSDAIRQYAASPRDEMKALFQRVGFTILVSNVDDHLKNHGFLYVGDDKWRLSPMFDVNPAPERFRKLKTAIADQADPEASIELLLDHAFCFEIERDEAVETIRLMAGVIEEKWQGLAREVGMGRADMETYRPAFESAESEYALRVQIGMSVPNPKRRQAASSAEGEKQTQYPSYKVITATPEVQADFLRNVREGFESQVQVGQTAAPLHEYMSKNIQVGGEPFSQVKHLTALENDSCDWDLDGVTVEVRKSLAEDAEALHSAECGYDVPHFITGFTAMVSGLKEQGVILDLERKAEPKEPRLGNVSADFDPT